MSFPQAFFGSFVYADAHCLEAGLDGFGRSLDGSVVQVKSLKLDGATVAIDVGAAAPASMYDDTIAALTRLGATACHGSIECTLERDGLSHDIVGHGDCLDSRSLPPRHYRWELLFAARAGSVERLRAVQSAGISLAQTLPAYYGYSPLHLAAASGSVPAVRVLLDAGIDPDVVPERDGMTPLVMAASGEIARCLLDAGAERDRPVYDIPPLVRACTGGRSDVARVLIEAGAAIPPQSIAAMARGCARHGDLATLMALATRSREFASALLSPVVTAAAIESGNVAMIDYLLERGAALPETLLEDALRAGSVALVQLALCAPDAVHRCGASSEPYHAMCRAAARGALPLLELLARHGVPIHPVKLGGTSPICEAVRRDHYDCVRWLLDRGAPAQATSRGESALGIARRRNAAQIVALLVARGATYV